jgi:surface antigen
MNKLVAVLVMAVAGMLCGVLMGGHAHAAENDGYPYANKPCVHAPYTTQGSGVDWCRNYDWGDRRNDTSAANVISPYGYYYRNCTDYAAWRLAGIGVSPAQYAGLGNAKQWATPAAAKGLQVNATPAVGSVGVRTTGTYGHVAFVNEVFADGTIRVSQYNRHADGAFSTATGTPAALGLRVFVHFAVPPPVMVTSAAPPMTTLASPPVIPENVALGEPATTPVIAEPPATTLLMQPEPTTLDAPDTPMAQPPDDVTVSAHADGDHGEAPPVLPPTPYEAPPAAAAPTPEPTPAPPVMGATPELTIAAAAPVPDPAPPAAVPRRVSELRTAGLASVVIPYAWQQPAAIPAVAVGRPGLPSASWALYVPVAALFMAAFIPILQTYGTWWRIRAGRYRRGS